MMRALSRLSSLSTSGRWALAVLAALVLLALLAPIVSPYSPETQLDIIRLKSQSPGIDHPFGTDSYSRDILARVLYGARVTLSVAALATLMAALVGTLYGIAAAMSAPWVDAVLMRVLDALLSIPRLLFLIALLALWNPVPIGGLILLLGLTGWFDVARLVRAEALSVREREFVLAARSLGAGAARIATQHVLPNVMVPVIVSTTLGVANVIALEASLSFLGIGAQEPNASWGTMFHQGVVDLSGMWWLALFPGLAMVATVVSFNVLGDALRQLLDPRQLGRSAGGTQGAAGPTGLSS
ncbi:MAG TPA: ABC transporter permease [Gemmatimonadaceae bacterium]|nr:ABC transporter permease [Gemmatimonadaceae bacterium]